MVKTDLPSRTIHAKLIRFFKNWGPLFVLFATGLWAVFTFVYKEHYVPASQRGFLTLDVQLSKVGDAHSFFAITALFNLKNYGKRTAYTAPGIFVAWGITLDHSHKPGDSFVESANLLFDSESYYSQPWETQGVPLIAAFKHSAIQKSDIVATGPLFTNFQFDPQSTGRHSALFVVPSGKYDYIVVEGRVPAFTKFSKNSSIEATWEIRSNESYSMQFYNWVDGDRSPVGYTDTVDRILDEIDWGESYAVDVISLWY